MPFVPQKEGTKVIKKNKALGTRRINQMLDRIGMTHKKVFGLEKGVWSDEKRVEAVNAFLILGSMQKVSEATGIPVDTLRDWRKFKPWWKELEQVLREEHDMGVAGELTDVVEKTIHAIADRVKNGDFVYNPRSGEISRVPVKASDLNKIASSMIDKRLTLQKQPTKYNATTDSKAELENKLAKLAETFSAFTNGHAGKAAKTAIEAVQQAEDGQLI